MKFKAVDHRYNENNVKIPCQATILIWREQPQKKKKLNVDKKSEYH